MTAIRTHQTIPISAPGETIREDYMKPLGLTTYAMAKALGIQAIALSKILEGTRAITAETAIRLERVTRAEAETWLNLQANYDLAKAKADKAFLAKVRKIKPIAEPAAAG